ncbi:hypothetical protein [Kitasatospora sp. NPDC008115]|uniref:hypothetical protein n=1 Tax=Kitasatospora sp. NPDC008115 TaxID=3364022 RepID=UPI0036F0A90B
MTRKTADRTAAPTRLAARAAWGLLGAGLLAWTALEALKHRGLTVPLAVLGLLVPWLAARTRGTSAVRRVLTRIWVPLAVMAISSLAPGSADSTAAPFAFGMDWLTHLALRRALSRNPH